MTKVIVVLALASSCAHAGYQAGYQADATVVGAGRYMIRSAPDSDERSEGIATQYAYRRATELCPDGYEVVESKVGAVTKTEHVAVFGRRSVEHPEVVLVVRCTGPTTKAP